MRRFTIALALATLTAGSALAIDGQVLVGNTARVVSSHTATAGHAGKHSYNVNHWLLRRSYREPVVNPLAGPPRARYARRGFVYHHDTPDPFDQVGTLREAGTISPRRPRAQVLRVDGALVDMAEERAIRRAERFEREDIDVRFHSPTEAYDARYPSVVYLDSE